MKTKTYSVSLTMSIKASSKEEAERLFLENLDQNNNNVIDADSLDCEEEDKICSRCKNLEVECECGYECGQCKL